VDDGAVMTTERTERESSHGARWLPWLVGAALLVAVVAAALRFSEEQAFVRLVQRAEPGWLVLAVFLQAGTYLAQGGIWRRVGAAAGYQLSRTAAFELGLAKLFADQTLPSAGVSSGVLIAKALEWRQVAPTAVNASVLVNVASYHLAYVAALISALAIMTWRGQTNALVVATALVFLLFSLGLSAAVHVVDGDPGAGRHRVGERRLHQPHDCQSVPDHGDRARRTGHVRGDVGADAADDGCRHRRCAVGHAAVSPSRLLAPDAAWILVLTARNGPTAERAGHTEPGPTRRPSADARGASGVRHGIPQFVLSRDEYLFSSAISLAAAGGAAMPFVTMSRFSSFLP
jgi:hypothetical protein